MKKLIITGIVVILSLTSYAQYAREDTPDSARPASKNAFGRSPFWDHVSVGGGFGLQFGTLTFVAVSPLFNYRVTSDFTIGVGPMYQYVNNSDPVYGFTYSIYGARIRSFYCLPGRLNNVYIVGEYDILNVPDYYSPFPQITRATIEIPLAGIGIRRPIGTSSFYTLEFLYDFSNSALSPYANPVINAGLDFGI